MPSCSCARSGTLEALEAVEVAIGRVLRIDPEALLHVVEAHVEVVVERPVIAVVAGAPTCPGGRLRCNWRALSDELARRRLRVAGRREAARRAVVAGRIGVARARPARRRRPLLRVRPALYLRAGKGTRRERVAEAADRQRIRRRVVFVRHHEHDEERVGAEELLSIAEDVDIDALAEVSLREGVELDHIVRIGLKKKEAIHRLELGLEPASLVADAAYELLRCVDEARDTGRDPRGRAQLEHARRAR